MATKKTTTKKTTTQKTPAKKTGSKQSVTRKPSAKKPAAAKAPARKPSAKKQTGKPASSKKAAAKRSSSRPSGLDLAAKVLTDAGGPLGAKDIAQRVIAAGWATSGKTPHATLYAAISREITTKGNDSRFAKAGRGLFEATGKGAS